MAEAYLGGHTVISPRSNPSWFSRGVAGPTPGKVRIRHKRLRTKATTAGEAAPWRNASAWAIAHLAAEKEGRRRKAQARSAAKAVKKAAAAAAPRIEAARARAKRQTVKAEAERQRQAAKAEDDRPTWRFRLTKRPDGMPALVSLNEVPR